MIVFFIHTWVDALAILFSALYISCRCTDNIVNVVFIRYLPGKCNTGIADLIFSYGSVHLSMDGSAILGIPLHCVHILFAVCWNLFYLLLKRCFHLSKQL